MRKIFLVAVLFFSLMGFLFCGCSEENSQQPSLELQKDIVLSSMKMVAVGSNEDKYEVKISLAGTADDLSYTMHPAVKKNIKGVEYMAWPMRVSGSRIVQYNRNSVNVHFRASSRVLKKFTYIAYIYTNSVGEKRFYVDDVSLDSKIL